MQSLRVLDAQNIQSSLLIVRFTWRIVTALKIGSMEPVTSASTAGCFRVFQHIAKFIDSQFFNHCPTTF